MTSERRRYDRLRTAENAYAALSPDFTKIGKIKDINKGGLSFEYINGEAIANKISQVDIFLSGNTVHLFKIPCRVIYEIPVETVDTASTPSGAITRRRCGIRFGILSKKRKEAIADFIDNYTIR